MRPKTAAQSSWLPTVFTSKKSTLEAIRMARENELGNLRIFNSVFCQQVVPGNIRVQYDEKHGGGPVYDLGVYCINAARSLFRAEPEEVFARSANNGEQRFRNVDEMTSVVMRFPKERLANFIYSFGAAATDSLTLVGTKGTLMCAWCALSTNRYRKAPR